MKPLSLDDISLLMHNIRSFSFWEAKVISILAFSPFY